MKMFFFFVIIVSSSCSNSVILHKEVVGKKKTMLYYERFSEIHLVGIYVDSLDKSTHYRFEFRCEEDSEDDRCRVGIRERGKSSKKFIAFNGYDGKNYYLNGCRLYPDGDSVIYCPEKVKELYEKGLTKMAMPCYPEKTAEIKSIIGFIESTTYGGCPPLDSLPKPKVD